MKENRKFLYLSAFLILAPLVFLRLGLERHVHPDWSVHLGTVWIVSVIYGTLSFLKWLEPIILSAMPQRIREYFDHSADIESEKINLHEVTNSMAEDFQRKSKKFKEELFAIANDETLSQSCKEEAMWKLYDRYSSKEKQQT